MPRRALLVAAALALTPAGVLAAARADAGPSTRAPRVLRLVAQPTGDGQVDNPPSGISVGDEFFEHGVITGRAGRRLGHYALTTQLVAGNASHGTEQSTVTVFLRGGQLVTAGGHATVDRFSMAVAGGTGRYAGARGTVAIAPGPHHTEHATVRLEG
ncbi:MAG: hypothetical protein M3071_14245 [Actinomycetota bacterium]|nr:hypothetical protein [Actinomycetota bacterium]